MSSTSTTRRSRSGCQVRTTTLRLRALARQSMERTSSPRTYSRSESNSVPWPRTRIAARPSSSRSRASRLGRCLRDSNGGSERTVPGDVERLLPRAQAERPAQPCGHADRAQVAAAPRLQRRCAAAPGRRARGRSGAGSRRRPRSAARRRARRHGPGAGRRSPPAAPTRRRTPAGPCRSGGGSRPGSSPAAPAAGRRRRGRPTTSSQSRTVLASGRSTTGTSPGGAAAGPDR